MTLRTFATLAMIALSMMLGACAHRVTETVHADGSRTTTTETRLASANGYYSGYYAASAHAYDREVWVYSPVYVQGLKNQWTYPTLMRLSNGATALVCWPGVRNTTPVDGVCRDK